MRLPDGWAGYLRHRDAISELLDPRCYSVEWLDQRILSRDAHVLANRDAVIVFEVRRYPMGAKEVHGLIAAGDLSAILPLIDNAECWGRSQGCVFATISSREGWRRVLEPAGYEPHQVELRKDLG